MITISAKIYAENHFNKCNKKGNESALNMSDLAIKAIRGIYDTEFLTKEQIKKYKR